MTQIIVCDECGEPIDTSQPYYDIVGTLVQVNEDGGLTTVEAGKNMQYHKEHLGQGVLEPAPGEEEPPVEEPPVEVAPTLTSLAPTQGESNSQTWVAATGTGFNDTAVVVLDGVEVTTAFVSDTEVGFTVDGIALGAGDKDVLVRQDGTDTATLQFRIT